jgi:hypothetical protein
MRVRIIGTTDDGGLQLALDGPLPRLPETLLIYPDAADQRFLTEPVGHAFAHSMGDHGHLKEVRAVARRYLEGQVDRAVAETLLAVALAGWAMAGATV